MKISRRGMIKVIFIMCISMFGNVLFVQDNHFNLITVNSVIIGFLFTTLSILLGFLNEKIIMLFEKAGSLKEVYENIEYGIIYSLLSSIISFINLIFIEEYVKNQNILNIMYSIELALMIFSLMKLLYTIKDLKVLIDSIRIDKKKDEERKKADEKVNEIIRNNK